MTTAPHPAHLRGRGEAGVSLIEMLVALIILSTAIVSLIGGIGASIVASDGQRKNVTSDSLVRSWAEKLQAAPYVRCAGTSETNYQPGALLVDIPSTFTATLTSIDYWNGLNPPGFSGTCIANTASDRGLERIVLVVRSTDGRGAARLEIMKRRP